MKITLKNGLSLECRCGRESCGLSKTPIVFDDLDCQNLWLPVGYQNFTRGSEFLERDRTQKAEFPNRKEACLAYIEDMQSGKINRFASLAVRKAKELAHE